MLATLDVWQRVPTFGASASDGGDQSHALAWRTRPNEPEKTLVSDFGGRRLWLCHRVQLARGWGNWHRTHCPAAASSGADGNPGRPRGVLLGGTSRHGSPGDGFSNAHDGQRDRSWTSAHHATRVCGACDLHAGARFCFVRLV